MPAVRLSVLTVLVLSSATRVALAEEVEPGVIVDRVVAVVGAAGERGRDVRIVTAFEADIEARLVLAERARRVEAAANGELAERLHEAVLSTIVNHLLIESEAARLELVSLSDEDSQAERQQCELRLGGPGSLERFREITGAPLELIDEIMRRRALVAVFVRTNIQLTTGVSDAEVEEAFQRGDHPFGDRPLDEIRAPIEAFIFASRQRERLEQWLEETRQRSSVRLIPE